MTPPKPRARSPPPTVKSCACLRWMIAAVAIASALLPFRVVHHVTTTTTNSKHSLGIPPPPESFGGAVGETMASSSQALSPCECTFGSCLQWNGPSSPSTCSMLYPLRYSNEWDDGTKALYQKHKRTMHFEVINIRRRNENDIIVGDAASSSSFCQHPTNYPFLLTYFHIFKNGGTTMRDAFRNYGKKIRRPYYTPEILFTGIQRHIGTDGFHDRLNATVQDIYQLQQQQQFTTPQQVAPFTFLREPISRFLSGLGQVLNKYKTGKLNKVDNFPLQECFVMANTTDLLDCTLQKMLTMLNDDNNNHNNVVDDTDGFPNQFMDFHLLPQAFLLRDFTGEQDIGIMLLDMANIQPILEMLLRLGKNQRSSFWARPSRGVHYTGGHLLAVEHLTQRQRHDICRLYRIDVELLQKTGGVIRDDQDNPCVEMLALLGR